MNKALIILLSFSIHAYSQINRHVVIDFPFTDKPERTTLIKEGFRIAPCVLHIGQSNCEGQDVYPNLTIQAFIDKYYYGKEERYSYILGTGAYGYDSSFIKPNAFLKFIHGKTNAASYLLQRFSVEASILTDLPPYIGNYLYYIKHGVGGCAITDRDYYLVGGNTWYPSQNSIFPKFVEKLEFAYQNAFTNKIILDVKCVIFQQGETEASESGNNDYPGIKDEYYDALVYLLDSLNDINNIIKIKYGAEHFGNNWFPVFVNINTNPLYDSTINAAYVAYKDSINPNTIIIPTESRTLIDASHWNANSNIQIGLDIVDSLVNKLYK